MYYKHFFVGSNNIKYKFMLSFKVFLTLFLSCNLSIGPSLGEKKA